MNSDIKVRFRNQLKKDVDFLVNSIKSKEDKILKLKDSELKNLVENLPTINTSEWFLRAAAMEALKPSTKEIILYADYIEVNPYIITNKNNPFNKINRMDEVFVRNKISFAPRSFLEGNPKCKQIIPYILIKNNNSYFVIKRESQSGEIRLIDKIGLPGGHVGYSEEDFYTILPSLDVFDIERHVNYGLWKELEEEVGIKEDSSLLKNFELVGYLYSENEKVSQDHLGLLYVLELSDKNIKTMEDGVISGNWFTKEDFINNYDKLETWLKNVFDLYINN